MSHETAMPTQSLSKAPSWRTGRSVALAVAAAALGTLLGFLMLIGYVVAAYQYWDGLSRNCAGGTPTVLWELGLSMLAGVLAAGVGLAYAGARAWGLNLRLAVPLTGLLLVPALVAGLFLIPTVSDYVIDLNCYG